jgi:hypothetical protein
VNCGNGSCSRSDLLGGWWAFLLWCVPTVLVVVGAAIPAVRAPLWIACFAVMGVACLINARGCGRLHCFVTGPLFLIASLATALDAFHVIRVSWKLVFLGAGVGTLFAYGLEWLRGKYVGTPVP